MENKHSDKFVNVIMIIVAFLFGLALSLIIDLFLALPLALAWNYVIPYLLGLPTLNFLRSFLLLSILSVLWKITIIPFQPIDTTKLQK